LKYKHHPPKGEDECAIELLQALSNSKDFKYAYTFNYTDLKERFIKYGGFTDQTIPTITYVHGSLEKSTVYSPQIVLGINTDYALPKAYAFLQKINNPYADAGNLALDLANSNEVIFYGLSMGRIDFEYFQSFFQSVVNTPLNDVKKHISILTKGEESTYAIFKNIYDMGIDLRALKEHSHFNIIDTQEAKFDGNGHYEIFHRLLDRIVQ